MFYGGHRGNFPGRGFLWRESSGAVGGSGRFRSGYSARGQTHGQPRRAREVSVGRGDGRGPSAWIRSLDAVSIRGLLGRDVAARPAAWAPGLGGAREGGGRVSFRPRRPETG